MYIYFYIHRLQALQTYRNKLARGCLSMRNKTIIYSKPTQVGSIKNLIRLFLILCYAAGKLRGRDCRFLQSNVFFTVSYLKAIYVTILYSFFRLFYDFEFHFSSLWFFVLTFIQSAVFLHCNKDPAMPNILQSFACAVNIMLVCRFLLRRSPIT